MIIKKLCNKMWDAIKLLFRRKFIALHDDMKREVNEMGKKRVKRPI